MTNGEATKAAIENPNESRPSSLAANVAAEVEPIATKNQSQTAHRRR